MPAKNPSVDYPKGAYTWRQHKTLKGTGLVLSLSSLSQLCDNRYLLKSGVSQNSAENWHQSGPNFALLPMTNRASAMTDSVIPAPRGSRSDTNHLIASRVTRDSPSPRSRGTKMAPCGWVNIVPRSAAPEAFAN
jgi:hypothetical protein